MIIVYHSKDLDGYASGAICKRKYPDAKLIGYDYGQDFPWDQIPEMESVIMVDVSLPMEQMHQLLDHSGDLTWIDHHKSAIEAYQNYGNWPDYSVTRFNVVLQSGIAACEGAWNYLFPLAEGHSMPPAVRLLGKYDTWRGAGSDEWEYEILPFQYGMRLSVRTAEDFPMYLLDGDSGVNIGTIKGQGLTILEYQRQQDKLAMHGAFECEFQGYKAIMCNVRGVGSLAFDSVLKPEHELMVGFGYTGRQWSFSLRTDKDDVDVSAIAKQFGGGGHMKAAGFAVDNLEEIIDLTQFKREKS